MIKVGWWQELIGGARSPESKDGTAVELCGAVWVVFFALRSCFGFCSGIPSLFLMKTFGPLIQKEFSLVSSVLRHLARLWFLKRRENKSSWTYVWSVGTTTSEKKTTFEWNYAECWCMLLIILVIYYPVWLRVAEQLLGAFFSYPNKLNKKLYCWNIENVFGCVKLVSLSTYIFTLFMELLLHCLFIGCICLFVRRVAWLACFIWAPFICSDTVHSCCP